MLAFFLLVGSVSTSATAGQVGSAVPPGVLSLADVIALALANDLAAQNAADAVTFAENDQALTSARLQPKFVTDALGAYGTSDLANQRYGLGYSQELFTGTRIRASADASASRNQLGRFYTTTSALSITQPLLRGFGGSAFRRDIEASRLRVADTKRQRDLTRQQTAMMVAASYYRIVAQGELVSVADAALRRARVLQEAAEAKLALGRVSRLDVLRARQLVVESELQLLDSKTAVEDAKDQIRMFVLRDSAFDFGVIATIPTSTEPVPRLEIALAESRRNRLELVSAAASVRQAEIQLESATDQLRPQIDLTLQMARIGIAPVLRNAFGSDRFQPAVFAGVSVPFDVVAARLGRQNSLMQLDRIRRDHQAAELRIAHEVRTAHRDLLRLEQTLAQSKAAIDFAEQEVELATLRYQHGLSNNLDVVTAEGSLLAARARRFSVDTDLAVARLRLKAATGTLDLVRDFQ